MSEMTQNDSPLDSEAPGAREKDNADTLIRLVTVIADRVDPLLKVITTVMERTLEAEKHETRFRITMAWIAVVIVTVIVMTACCLTYLGKLDGSTLGFLLGLVVGYVLTFVRNAIEPSGG